MSARSTFAMRPKRLPRELTWADAFRFPVSTQQARRDLIAGGLIVVVFLLVVEGHQRRLGVLEHPRLEHARRCP
jgi:hypothetical protein